MIKVFRKRSFTQRFDKYSTWTDLHIEKMQKRPLWFLIICCGNSKKAPLYV